MILKKNILILIKELKEQINILDFRRNFIYHDMYYKLEENKKK